MKKLLPVILALSVTPAFADEDGSFHLGVKTGSIDIDVSGFDADTPKGIVFGYQKGTMGVEVEANFTDFDYDYAGYSRSADYRSLALYGVYRSEGDVYFKAKAGVLHEEIKASFASEDDMGFSAGIGGGINLGSFSLEAEYTILESDVNFISIGANFNF